MKIETNIVQLVGTPPLQMSIIPGESNKYTKDVLFDANGVQDVKDELYEKIISVNSDIQEQIDGINARADVVDIVASKAAFDTYDTSDLTDKDVLKVLIDETHNDSTTYYRYNEETGKFEYLGTEGSYYTKAVTDEKVAAATTKVNPKTSGHVTVSSSTNADNSTTYTISENDIASANELDEEINRAKTAETSIDSVVGLSKQANGEARGYVNEGSYIGKSSTNTIAKDIKALDSQVRTNANDIATLQSDNTTEGSVAKDIKDAVESLDSSVADSGKYVTVSVTETDGKLTSLSVSENETYLRTTINEEINRLDVGDITAADGSFISSVSEKDGKVSAATREMPTVSEISETGKPIIKVSQTKGTVSAETGNILATSVFVTSDAEDNSFAANSVEDAITGLETKINTDVQSEASARQQEDQALAAAISNEATRAQQAEAIITEAMQESGQELQAQIDAMNSHSDVVDVVSNYEVLGSYDTSTLTDADIIKVLADETQDNATTYYRWSTEDSEFSYVGKLGPYYTIAESDDIMDTERNRAQAAETAAFTKVNEKPTGHVVISSTTNSDNSITYTLTENDIASAAELVEETLRAKNAETALDSIIGSTKNATTEARTYTNTGNYIGKASTNTVTSDVKALDTQVKTNEDAIALLNDSVDKQGSVVKSIKDYVDTLDSTKTGYGNLLNVTVEEEDGKIKSVAVTEDASYLSGVIDTKINALDVDAITAPDGSFVSQVSETDGKISASTKEMPTVSTISEAGKPIVSVSQSKGTVSATTGTIYASNVTIADANNKFDSNTVEDALAEIDTEYKQAFTDLADGVSADYNTLNKLENHIKAVAEDAKSYQVVQVTGDELKALGTDIKEAYKLVDEDNTQAGPYVKIYKDALLKKVELKNQDLIFTYVQPDGTEDTAIIDFSDYLVEEEFGDGLQVVDNEVSLKKATSTTLGGIKVGTNLNIDTDGVLSAVDTTYNDATQTVHGLMSTTDKIKLDCIEDNANNYSLPTASSSTLGGVKVGTNLNIDTNGVLSATDTLYTNGSGLKLNDTKFSVNTDYTTSGRNYKVQVDNASGGLFVNVPWTDTDTDTHYTTKLYAGKGDAENYSTINGDTKLTVTDNDVVSNSISIKGNGATTVTSDATGTIIISSTDTNTQYNTLTAEQIKIGTETEPKVITAQVARTAIDETVSGDFNDVKYDSATKKINFLRDSNVVKSLDASAFIKDGMVSNVTVSGGNIVITFNTDAGKDDIKIPVSDIFNSSNYYTKSSTDTLLNAKADKTATVSNVTYDSTNKKITKTINGTTSDVVTLATAKKDMALDNVENKSSATIRGELTKANVTTALGYTPPTSDTTYTFTNKNATLAWNTKSTIATIGGTDITVTMPANPDTNTTYTAGTGLLLSGTVFKAKLNNETSLGTIGTTGKLYAVGVDANGQLAVSVPWTDTNTTYGLVGANGTQGLVKNGSAVTSASGYTACPIIGGIPYYKDTDTDTHYNTRMYVGTSNGNVNAATANGATYLMVLDNTTVRDRHLIKGTGATTVTSDVDGNITINSTDNNTTYSAGTGLALSGTTFALATSGVTAGTYGPSANVNGANGNTINVPEIKVDAYGRVTSVTNRVYTSVNTDTNTTYTIGTSGNSVTLTPAGGSAQSITVPYATSANSASSATTATTSNYLALNSRMDYGWSGVNYFNANLSAGNAAKTNDAPSTAWWHIMRFNHGNSAGFYTDLAIPFNDVCMYYKRVSNGTVANSGWVRVLDRLNTYISNGVITINGTSITPLTSHQSVSNKGATLAWGTATTVATIGSTNINVSLPANPNTWKAANASQEGYVPKSLANKILRSDSNGALYWGDDANTTYSFSNSNPTLAWGTKSTIGTVGGVDLTVTMPANPNTNTTYTASNGVGLSGTTFYNSGVRSIESGSTNGTISVNTNGYTANVAVAGLNTAAYKAYDVNAFVIPKPNAGGTMSDASKYGNSMGMINLTANSGTNINPNNQSGWHHFINLSHSDHDGTNMWQTQFANAAGSTDLWVRSRKGGNLDASAWAAPWTRILTGTNWSNVVTKSALGLGNVTNYDTSKAIKSISRSGTTFTYTCLDNTTGTFTQQDNNTTYSANNGISLSGTTFGLSSSGVTAGTYGPSANVTGSNNATISVPQITVDAYGRVTSVTNRTYTSVNTDTNTTYNVATSSSNGLMSSTDKAKLDGIKLVTCTQTEYDALTTKDTNTFYFIKES